MWNIQQRYFASTLTLAVCSLTLPCFSAAQAQTVPDTQASAENDAAIQEIVVNARLRQESLQDTPIAMSAITAQTTENSVVTDITGVQKFIPNVQLGRIAFSGNSLSASIRGVSFADLEKTFDPAVGVAIDGVFLGTSTGANIDFSDLESVEVLRGPQGTLFGRNTVGGVISVRRSRPTGELGAKVNTRYGSYNTFDLGAVVNLPTFGGGISTKISGLRRTTDSFTRNRVTGEREKGRDYYTLGIAVLAEVGEDTSILASVDYQKDRSTYPSNINLTKATGLPFGAGGTICDLTFGFGLGDLGCDTQGYLKQRDEKFRYANTTIPFESFIDGWSASLEINSKLGDLNLTAVTGYRNTNDTLLVENTGAPLIPLGPGFQVPLFVAARDQDYKQFSQEIRVQADLSDAVDIVAGVYYLHSDYEIRPLAYNGSTAGSVYLFNGPIQRLESSQQLSSFAVFAESIIDLGNNIRATVGGRFTTETKKFSTKYTLPVQAAFTAEAEATFNDPTGRVILDWKPNDQTLVYASWSRGVRSGGFNGRGTTPTSIGPYDPERVDSFEVGAKADFADGRFRFNPTVFQANYRKKQEEIVRAAPSGGTETIVENASSARIRGIEIEMLARPTPELTLRASAAYLDAKYQSFLLPDLSGPSKPPIDVSDSRNFRRAPKHTFNAGADYARDIGGGNSLNLTIDYVYTGDTFVSGITDVTGAERDVIQGRGGVDVSVAFIHAGENVKNFRVSGYARDLFSSSGGRLAAALDAGIFYFGVVVPTREFGVEASIKF